MYLEPRHEEPGQVKTCKCSARHSRAEHFKSHEQVSEKLDFG